MSSFDELRTIFKGNSQDVYEYGSWFVGFCQHVAVQYWMFILFVHVVVHQTPHALVHYTVYIMQYI